ITTKLQLSPTIVLAAQHEPAPINAVVTNPSEAIWLPRSAGLGAVMLGCHVYHHEGTVFRESFHWEPLSSDDNRAIKPGETVTINLTLPVLPAGDYRIIFDMVSNDVCWFAVNGSETATVELTVRA